MNHELIIGLGNPGAKYQNTRHNLGQRVLKNWVIENKSGDNKWQELPYVSALTITISLPDLVIDCLIPLTYMNESGTAVTDFLKKMDQSNKPDLAKDVLIVHDDLDLELGQTKLKQGGSARGHKGVKSIHQSLNTQDLPRLMIGIDRPTNQEQSIKNYVLDQFTPAEEKKLAESLPEINQAITNFVTKN